MYIVKKKVSGKDYYYLRKAERKDGKVVSKDIAYLGKTKKEAETKYRNILKPEKTEKIVEGKKIGEIKKQKEMTVEELATFCKRKDFVYNSGEIYGGLSGFWDFGVVGTEFKNNIKREWWKFFVQKKKDIVGIDGAIITHPRTWEASGHVESFSDVSVECRKCRKVNKVDRCKLAETKCGYCKGDLDVKTAKDLNLMFKTQVGPIEQNSVISYLRPETAQLIFTNFKQVAENSRLKLPFGIAQIGKAFRNEIAPRDFIFRSREFEQMEIEYFIMPDEKCEYKIPDIKIKVYSADMQEKNKEAEEMKINDALKKKIIKRDWHTYWLSTCLSWFKNLGCNMENFRIRQHNPYELAHYSSDCWDIQYKFPFGWQELMGIADRGDYDLSRHEKFSNKDLKIFIEGKGKILPHVVAEPSLGVERAFIVFMLEAYNYDEKRENIVLKFSPKLSPYKCAIFPIVKNSEFLKFAEKIYSELKEEFFCVYDESGSLGRRYARQDEIGTPFCITIDGDSIKNKDVTVRDRDTTKQIRVKAEKLSEIIKKLIAGKLEFENAGKIVETRKK